MAVAINMAPQGPSTQEQAAAAANAGQADEAIRLYSAVLQQEPDNVAALSSMAALLQSQRKWQEATPVLERLTALRPQDSAALYQLGSMKSWQTGQRAEALDLLHRACDLSDHNPEYCQAYAEVLSWNTKNRTEAVAQLGEILAQHPENVPARLRLAQMLSWDKSTRQRALALYDQGLQFDAENTELLIASAEVLSWSVAGRPEAMVRYDRVLLRNPNEPRALTGKAQLLAWHDHTGEALELYRRVLAKDSNNPSALRGEAEILNWKGRYTEARSLAKEAYNLNNSDERASLELAKANIGLHRFGEAQQAMAGISNADPDFRETRQEIHRGLGTYMDFGYFARLSNDLSFQRPYVAVSTKVGLENRVIFSWQPTMYESNGFGFNTNHFDAGLVSEPSDRFTSSVHIGASTFNNVPANADGGFDLRYKPITSTTLKFAFLRAPVEETTLSTRGLDVIGLGFLGQVYSNLGDLGVNYYNSTHHWDASVDYIDGAYTGRNLVANRRYSMDGQLGKALHADQPYLRLGYQVDYTSFGYDADIQDGVPPSHYTGGYFSPTRFLLNQGVLNMSSRFSHNVFWEASGAVGTQNVENLTSVFSDVQLASSFETHLVWRATPMNELTFGYAYLDVFNSFQRNLFRFSWRHYF
jgi:tetratricopeptide (TPR) repeat protein